MKSGIYALYHGKEYTSGKNKKGKYILRSTDINDLEDGFLECEPFYFGKSNDLIVCYKYVESDEIDQYYYIRTIAKYKDYEFEVVEENEKQVSIVTMIGDYHEWKRLEMECIDKGVYQKWVDKENVKITIKKEILLFH